MYAPGPSRSLRVCPSSAMRRYSADSKNSRGICFSELKPCSNLCKSMRWPPAVRDPTATRYLRDTSSSELSRVSKWRHQSFNVAARPATHDALHLLIFLRERFEAETRQRRRIRVHVQRGAIDCGAEQQSVQLEVVFDVVLLLALLHLVERRVRGVDVTALDENGHLTIKESE